MNGFARASMRKNNSLGQFEQNVLISVFALEPEAFGLAIQRKTTGLYFNKNINETVLSSGAAGPRGPEGILLYYRSEASTFCAGSGENLNGIPFGR